MPKPKGAGDLRQRVKFQRRQEIDDGYGNTQGGWADLDISRSCSMTPSRGNEQVQADRLAGLASWDCWVRSDSGTRSIGVGDRVVDLRTGQTFGIVFVGDMDGHREWLLIQCRSGGADG